MSHRKQSRRLTRWARRAGLTLTTPGQRSRAEYIGHAYRVLAECHGSRVRMAYRELADLRANV